MYGFFQKKRYFKRIFRYNHKKNNYRSFRYIYDSIGKNAIGKII